MHQEQLFLYIRYLSTKASSGAYASPLNPVNKRAVDVRKWPLEFIENPDNARTTKLISPLSSSSSLLLLSL